MSPASSKPNPRFHPVRFERALDARVQLDFMVGGDAAGRVMLEAQGKSPVLFRGVPARAATEQRPERRREGDRRSASRTFPSEKEGGGAGLPERAADLRTRRESRQERAALTRDSRGEYLRPRCARRATSHP